MDLFTLRGVSAGYRERRVLNDISLSVREGEFAAIIGPNGAGKSTFIKLLGGHIHASEGEMLFTGTDYRKFGARELGRRFSMVHQSFENLIPFPVYEFVRFGRFPHQSLLEIETDEDSRIIRESLEMTDTWHLRERPVTELSGGELQLVFIAHSLAHNNRVLLLDEPVSHLDMKHAIQIMDILHNLNRKGSTVITVLHDINLASDYCGRIIGLKEGRLFVDDTPDRALKYGTIEELYGTLCVVTENPVTKKPAAFPVPEYAKKVK